MKSQMATLEENLQDVTTDADDIEKVLSLSLSLLLSHSIIPREFDGLP